MTEQPRPDPDDNDEEPPIAELANLSLPVSAQLSRRVAVSIHRRETTKHLTTLHWIGLGAVLTEFARLGVHCVTSSRARLP